MPETTNPWSRNDAPTKPRQILPEEILGSDENILDAQTHPFRDEKTPPYGTNIPPEIYKAVKRQTQETTTGGVPSLAIAEIAANERARQNPPPRAAILRKPTKK